MSEYGRAGFVDSELAETMKMVGHDDECIKLEMRVVFGQTLVKQDLISVVPNQPH